MALYLLCDLGQIIIPLGPQFPYLLNEFFEMVSEGPQFGILRVFPSTAFDCFPELLFFPVFHTLSCHEAELRDTPWASVFQPVK